MKNCLLIVILAFSMAGSMLAKHVPVGFSGSMSPQMSRLDPPWPVPTSPHPPPPAAPDSSAGERS